MNSSSQSEPVNHSAITKAARRIADHAIATPLVKAGPMSQRCGSTVFIKPEHRQRTGSFKLRGALNKTFGLSEAQASAGVITASTGNHGIGVATAAAAREIPCTVYLPTGASASKVNAISSLGATIVTVEATDTAVAEVTARAAAQEQGITFISPYNDPRIIAGQGTIGLEIDKGWSQLGLASLDAVVVAVGGGGLISGIASWLKQHRPEATIIGASPENDQAMAASVAAGEIIEPPASKTFSDGTAGAVEAGSVTFDICADLVDRWMAISEFDIATAVTKMIDDHGELVEGAAGVALAAAEQYGAEHPGSNVVVVSCGGNVSSASLRAMLAASAESLSNNH